jgi:hypothetical protein
MTLNHYKLEIQNAKLCLDPEFFQRLSVRLETHVVNSSISARVLACNFQKLRCTLAERRLDRIHARSSESPTNSTAFSIPGQHSRSHNICSCRAANFVSPTMPENPQHLRYLRASSTQSWLFHQGSLCMMSTLERIVSISVSSVQLTFPTE